jgi:hypothetical protein
MANLPAIKRKRERQIAFVDEILRRVAIGETATEVCKSLASRGGPLLQTFRRWVVDDDPKGIAERYARAREAQCEAWADEMHRRATRSTKGVKREVIKGPDGKTIKVVEGDAVERDRLAIDTMKWLMSKLHPRRYGEFMDAPTPPPAGPIIITIDPFRNHREVMAETAALALESGNGHNGNGSNGHKEQSPASNGEATNGADGQ